MDFVCLYYYPFFYEILTPRLVCVLLDQGFKYSVRGIKIMIVSLIYMAVDNME